MVLSHPLVFEVPIVHHIVDQNGGSQEVPEWSKSGVLAVDVLGSIGMDKSCCAR